MMGRSSPSPDLDVGSGRLRRVGPFNDDPALEVREIAERIEMILVQGSSSVDLASCW